MKKTPFVTKEQIEEIVKTYPTPFHLYDEAGIRKNAQAVKDAFSWNPGFREYFAVKATPKAKAIKLRIPSNPQIKFDLRLLFWSSRKAGSR